MTNDVIPFILISFRFQNRFSAGKMRDTTCAFYKIQQNLAKNPGILSEDEVIFLWILDVKIYSSSLMKPNFWVRLPASTMLLLLSDVKYCFKAFTSQGIIKGNLLS